ncbi:type II secretory pathway pseudopilin PulG [Xanthomonas sacchari]|uniref:shufflon system plasmid conjugative transfer pilus tip adhesin PilV n=1 Tax=Xanthomonas sacchari TaxID=56458 RepID=UPI00278707F9|nr:shufflon system plasmid conjugative transfer pilus tip adhesin PilV [Xanthomonas sacchari]MDQ1090594.1 type II secretory pathway pseudopilin PulG [Xanthomonas sacchari]
MKAVQRGFALLELVIALGILAALTIAIVGVMRSQAQSKQVAIAATQLVDFTKATERYVQNEYSSILSTAGPTTPAVITVAQLQSAGLLPSGYPGANVFGQVPTGRARKASATSLETLVVYTGGSPLSQGDLDELAGLAAQQGIAGGYVGSSDTTRAIGALGAWSLPLSNFAIAPGAGHIAANLSYTSDATNDTALHRQAIPGRPELNRMSTAIDMAGNSLNNGGLVQGSEVLGGNLSLGGTRWGNTPYPYETISLPTGENFRFSVGGNEQAVLSGSGELSVTNRIRTNTVSAVDVRADSGLYAGSLVNAPTYQGNEYYANGWFRTTGQTGWYSEAYGGGWHMTDTTWIRAYNNKNIYTGGEMQAGVVHANSSLQVDGRATVNEYIQLQGGASKGGGCSPNGLIGREDSGALLSCVSGVWRGSSGLNGYTVVAGPGQSQGQNWAYAVCPSGTVLTGGGYNVTYMQRTSSQEAPQVNRPEPGMNAWAVYAGGGGGTESRFLPYAVCGY